MRYTITNFVLSQDGSLRFDHTVSDPGSMTDTVLQIEDVVFGWPGEPPLLTLGRFSLAANETLFLHGPSGSGKSTLLSLISGVLTPREGLVRVAGQPMSSLSASRRDRLRADQIGIVFQLFNLLPYLTAAENVLLAVQTSKERRARLGGPPREVAEDLLVRLGIDTPNRKAALLSVGQQQRVAAARALVGTPPLIIADEPTSALDEPRREAFLDVLTSEAARAGSAILFVSHDERLAHRFGRTASLAEMTR